MTEEDKRSFENRSAVAFHDQVAGEWDEKYQKRGFEARKRAIVSLLTPATSGRWLDAGCGTGSLSRKFASLGCVVHGVDASPRMVQEARRLAKEQDLSDSTTFDRIETVESLPFDDSRFDGVICSSVLEYLDHPDECLREFYRVLRGGGILIVSIPNKNSILRILRHALHSVSRYFGLKPLSPYLQFSRNEYSLREALRLLAGHGFTPTKANFTGSGFPEFLDRSSIVGNLIVVLATKGGNSVRSSSRASEKSSS
jgi:2-polyprenyl-3-methyl-5-hydroxy-6-metoxy-1,4-benzoquinol methylase